MTFLAPFLKINEYNKNTQSNIFNICIQEVIRGRVNWMETNLAMQSKTTKHSFLMMSKFGPEPAINWTNNWSADALLTAVHWP